MHKSSTKRLIRSIMNDKVHETRSIVYNSLYKKVSEEIENKAITQNHDSVNMSSVSRLVDFLTNITNNDNPSKMLLNSGESVVVDPIIADSLLTLLNAIDDNHKIGVVRILLKNVESFLKAIKFTIDSVGVEQVNN